MFHPSQMTADDTGLLIVDVQEKLVPKILGAPTLVRNIAFLIDSANLLGLPVQATEQYPRGLGPTVPELLAKLPERPDKITFSCCAVPEVVERFRTTSRPKVLLAGIETHVCIQQTALDLLALDFRVYVAADAVGSRYRVDHDYALARLEKAGCVLTTAESAAFEWVGGADHPHFKTFSKLVQERMQSLSACVSRET